MDEQTKRITGQVAGEKEEADKIFAKPEHHLDYPEALKVKFILNFGSKLFNLNQRWHHFSTIVGQQNLKK